MVALENRLLPTLHWWKDRKNTRKGVSLLPFQPKLSLYMDASQEGYGATLGRLELTGKWAALESQLHSNNRGLLVVVKAVKHFEPHLTRQAVLICSYSTTTVATINKQEGTKSWELTHLATELWRLLDQIGCMTRARNIPGKLHVLADHLFRTNQDILMEWTILAGLLQGIWQKWGRPQVDLFTTKQNHQLPLYVSPIPDPASWKVNALAISWMGMFVYASPMADSQPSPAETSEGLGRYDSNCSLPGQQTLAPSIRGHANRHSHSAAKSNQSFKTKPLRDCSQATRFVKSSCLEIIRESNLNKGFSSSVATRIAKNARQSSRMIYESKWTVFLQWARDNKVKKASMASVPIITNFLGWLFESKDLKVSTIKGYRSTICRVIKLTGGLDFSEDPHPHLNALVRSFTIERPATKQFPKWDLVLVIKYLMKAPFKPLCSESLLNLTKKTVFLLALASGELHSLDLDETLMLDVYIQ